MSFDTSCLHLVIHEIAGNAEDTNTLSSACFLPNQYSCKSLKRHRYHVNLQTTSIVKLLPISRIRKASLQQVCCCRDIHQWSRTSMSCYHLPARNHYYFHRRHYYRVYNKSMLVLHSIVEHVVQKLTEILPTPSGSRTSEEESRSAAPTDRDNTVRQLKPPSVIKITCYSSLTRRTRASPTLSVTTDSLSWVTLIRIKGFPSEPVVRAICSDLVFLSSSDAFMLGECVNDSSGIRESSSSSTSPTSDGLSEKNCNNNIIVNYNSSTLVQELLNYPTVLFW